jgi:hypothetical protein
LRFEKQVTSWNRVQVCFRWSSWLTSIPLRPVSETQQVLALLLHLSASSSFPANAQGEATPYASINFPPYCEPIRRFLGLGTNITKQAVWRITCPLLSLPTLLLQGCVKGVKGFSP